MSLYQAKHKARGRYGVVDPQGRWLSDFLGNKEQAVGKAAQLNLETQQIAGKTTKTILSNRSRLQHFILTKQGWLNKGEH